MLVQPLRRRELPPRSPRSPPARRSARPGSTPGRGRGALPHFAGRRVLVADDSAVNREVALEALSQLGCAVTLVDDGRAAVEAAGAGRSTSS